MAAEAEEINIGFLKRMREGRPFVRVKVGMSLDGRTALANGASQWITSEASREDVQHWRARSSAVLTGIGTVLADNPRLDVRLPGAQRQPQRVILDTSLRTPPAAKIVGGDANTIIFTASQDAGRIAELEQRGARIERVEKSDGQLRSVLTRLAQLAANEVLVEAGPRLTGAFVRHGMADELLLYIAPKLLGPQARPLFDLPLLEDLQQARQFSIIDQRMTGADLRLRLRPA
jgi:diaminohydroxyphosphoribosylaminopyrimidine deaminase/5-amino-6-(5-phosphoribosylamino)uracil reductase